MLTGDELLKKVQELGPSNESKRTAFTKENLDKLWNAIEYTRGTIPTFPEKWTDPPSCVYIDGGRAHQSRSFLDDAINIINQMRSELNNV